MLELEIPVLGQKKVAAKPGRGCSSTRFSALPSHIPASVRWTRYGRWDDQGSTVTNQHTIYRTPEAIRAAIAAASKQAFATPPRPSRAMPVQAGRGQGLGHG